MDNWIWKEKSHLLFPQQIHFLLLNFLPTVLHQTPLFWRSIPFLLDPPQDTKSPMKGKWAIKFERKKAALLFPLKNCLPSLNIPAHCAPPNPPVLVHYPPSHLILLRIQNHHWRGKWAIKFERKKAAILFPLKNCLPSLNIPAHCAPPNPPVLVHYPPSHLILLRIQNYHWRGKWTIEFERKKAAPFFPLQNSFPSLGCPLCSTKPPCFGALSPFLLDPPQDTKSHWRGKWTIEFKRKKPPPFSLNKLFSFS